MKVLSIETKASLTRANGDPIDYVPNHARTDSFDQSGNMMSRSYRKRCVGVAPHLWNVDPTPSLTRIVNGRKVTMTVKEFRGRGKVSSDRVAEIQAERQERKHRLLMKVGGYDQPETR